MRGARDLVASERGWFCLAVLVLATVLVLVKAITGDNWVALTMSIVGFLVAGKTASGIAERRAGQPATGG